MKNIIILAMLFVSAKTSAQLLYDPTAQVVEEKAPAPLTDSTIERKLEDGKIQQFDGNDWMIVPRKAKKPKAAPAPAPAPQIVEKTVTVEKTVFVEKKTYQKNRISLLAGEGPRNGLETYSYGTTMENRNRMGAVGGLQYQYSFTEHWSAALQVQTNPSCLIGVGYGW